jgi:CrcB protein
MIKWLLYIGVGGFLGAIARFGLTNLVQHRLAGVWPYGTFAVNLFGCFIIGLLFVYSERGAISAEWRLFLSTGLCGGFTTFSTYSLEIFALLRQEHYGAAASYTLLSVLLGLLGVWAGWACARMWIS